MHRRRIGKQMLRAAMEALKKKKKIYSRNDRHLLNVFKGCFKWDFDDANIAVRKQRPSYIFSTDVTDL